MSSIRRKPNDCAAVIKKDDDPAGVVLLPASEPEGFIAEFNRTYASIGWKIESMSPVKVVKPAGTA